MIGHTAVASRDAIVNPLAERGAIYRGVPGAVGQCNFDFSRDDSELATILNRS
jgi:hypothetical protein